MKTIKFRAWDKRFKRMDYGGGALLLRINSTDFSEPMQFTGLHDKNGKEIWEGDVVEVSVLGEKELRTVEFIEGGWCVKTLYKQEFNGGYKPRYLHRHFHDYLETPNDTFFEVIGNIYSNPELLKP